MKLIASLLLSLALATCCIAAQPTRFNYQAKITDGNGVLLQGNQSCTFWIYEGGTGGEADSGKLRYKETALVPASNGVINHVIGTGTPDDAPLAVSVFDSNDDLFVQLAVGAENNVILPRQRIESVPFAINAANGEKRMPLTDDGAASLEISEPGSYYLTQNVSGAGIVITSDDVTLDLNGYSLLGDGSTFGVQLSTVENVAIHNGTIRNYAIGIGNNGTSVYAHNLRITQCTQAGIRCGSSAFVEDVIVNDLNGIGSIMRGIDVGMNSIVRRCTVSNITSTNNDNSVYGIRVSGSSIVQSCTVSALFGGGSDKELVAIQAATFCSVMDCNANNCLALVTGPVEVTGIKVEAGCHVSRNNVMNNMNATASGNVYGIRTGDNCKITTNHCSSNRFSGGTGVAAGISVGAHSNVAENHCSDNKGSTSNQNYGIHYYRAGGGGTMIIRNTTSGNTDAGIRFENTNANPNSTNYHAENIINEDTPISSAGGPLVAGTGDRANVNF